MSNIIKNQEVLVPTTDLSEQDLINVNRYVEEGLMGIGSIPESKMVKIMDLYLTGKTYRQISGIVGVKKTIVMYLSHKFGWFATKNEYLHELDLRMKDRIIESKIVNQDFLLQLTHMWQTKIGSKINKFLATGDSTYADEIDPKEIGQYLKTVEVLHKLSSEGSRGSNPAVGLNLGEGVTIKKVGDNQVEITPKENTVASMLKQFADYRREEENKPKPGSRSDIKEVTEVTDGEVNEV